MSRGGRAGGSSNRNLPFDVDPALEEILAYDSNDDKPLNDPTRHYPRAAVPKSAPPTEEEKRLLDTWRAHQAARRASPYFLGQKAAGRKKDPAKRDPYLDPPTWSNAQRKKAEREKEFGKIWGRLPMKNGLPDVTKVGINWSLMPKELRGLEFGNDTDDDFTEDKAAKAVEEKKRAAERLARIADDEDDDTGENVASGDEENDADDDGAGEPGSPDALEDDAFEEDEEGDYNAEQFFDNGEDDDEGDDGGDDGRKGSKPYVEGDSIDDLDADMPCDKK